MATPGGHPDYQDYVNWRGPIYANLSLDVTSATPFNVSEYVTNFQSVYLFIDLILNNGWTVTVEYFTDNTMSQLVYAKTYVMRSGNTLSAIIPNLANFINVLVDTGQVGTMAGYMYLAPQNNPTPRIHYPMQDNNLSKLNLSVPGTSNVTFLMPYVMEGDGMLSVSADVFTGGPQVSIIELNEAGVGIARVLPLTTFGAPSIYEFKSPPNPIQIEIINNDAVAHNYTFWAEILDN